MGKKLSIWTRSLFNIFTRVTFSFSNLTREESDGLTSNLFNELRSNGIFVISYNLKYEGLKHQNKYVDYVLADELTVNEILSVFPDLSIAEVDQRLGKYKHTSNTLHLSLFAPDTTPRQKGDFYYNTHIGFYRCSSIRMDESRQSNYKETLSPWTRALFNLPHVLGLLIYSKHEVNQVDAIAIKNIVSKILERNKILIFHTKDRKISMSRTTSTKITVDFYIDQFVDPFNFCKIFPEYTKEEAIKLYNGKIFHYSTNVDVSSNEPSTLLCPLKYHSDIGLFNEKKEV